MQRTFKCSTIVVSTQQGCRSFGSPEAIPLELRKKMSSCFDSMQTATIIIADRQGRVELGRLMRGEPTSLDLRSVPRLPKPSGRGRKRSLWPMSLIAAVVILLLAAWTVISLNR